MSEELKETTPEVIEPGPETPSAESAPERTERRRASRRLLRAEVFYVAGLALFALMAALARYNAYFGWDLRAARAVQSVDAPGVREAMEAASFFGDGWTPWILAGATMFLFLAFRRRSEAAGVVLSTAGAALLNSVLKAVIARPRPTSDLVSVIAETQNLSFPSGHVTFYVAYFGFVFFVAYALLPRGSAARRVVLALTGLQIVLVGFSRVYLGAHWPSDTLGAYLVTGLWLAFTLHMYRRWKRRATFKQSATAAG
ncbi:MAG TPA: phosphatase PAP2 family protein [Pyrinomonadaceae bacterium]|nr:phosphatase PAP2 family protein [Pyrinomonadaceae bacterium]